MPKKETAYYQNLFTNPNIHAFLETIRRGEGTLGVKGYSTLVGGSQFSGFGRHPRIYKRKYNSTAAGAYQFVYKTWTADAKDLGLKDFSPINQDIAAIYELKKANALGDILNGNIASAIKKSNAIWLSLPGAKHDSVNKYSQKLNDAIAFYKKNKGLVAANVTTTDITEEKKKIYATSSAAVDKKANDITRKKDWRQSLAYPIVPAVQNTFPIKSSSQSTLLTDINTRGAGGKRLYSIPFYPLFTMQVLPNPQLNSGDNYSGRASILTAQSKFLKANETLPSDRNGPIQDNTLGNYLTSSGMKKAIAPDVASDTPNYPLSVSKHALSADFTGDGQNSFYSQNKNYEEYQPAMRQAGQPPTQRRYTINVNTPIIESVTINTNDITSCIQDLKPKIEAAMQKLLNEVRLK